MLIETDKQTALDMQNQSATKADVARMIAASEKTRSRPPKAARNPASKSNKPPDKNNSARKKDSTRKKDSARKSDSARKKSNSGSSGKGGASERGSKRNDGQKERHNTPNTSPHYPPVHSTETGLTEISNTVQHRAVLSLSNTPVPPSLEKALGLGPSFRPTPKPITDRTLIKSLRAFGNSVKNKAFHILYPAESEREYIPKLYVSTGIKCDPKCDALDNCLGYSSTSLVRGLCLQRPISKRIQQEYRAMRQQLLRPKPKSKTISTVTALKIPYTSRTKTLQNYLKLSRLQDSIEKACPALGRASIGRFVINSKHEDKQHS